MTVEDNAKRSANNKKDSFWSVVKTKLKNAYWFRVIIVIGLFTAPHYLQSFFPIPAQAQEDWFWNSVPAIPWIYLLILVIRGAILIFLVWAVVRLVTSDE